ncbi:MAG: HAMP domain-containing sensor histidine kinase [Polyangiales bacterium]|nr:HAMP domain-containing histidine kinase [Myxococcales bacterium]
MKRRAPHGRGWHHGRHADVTCDRSDRGPFRRRHPHRGHPGSLQRRLFLSFGGAMLVASVAAGVVGFVLHPAERGPDLRSAQAFVAARFAERWGDEAALEALAEELHEASGLTVRLESTSGHARLTRGPRCGRFLRPTSVVRAGEVVGRATVCDPRRPRFFPHGVLLTLAFVTALWWSSGVIARRLARPLEDTALVARRIGEGALDARVHVRRRSPAEVQHLARAINDMAARVASTLAEQKMLLASVSHEIRTPLGHLRLLVDHAADAGLEPHLTAELEREVLEIDDLVAQLLAGSKLDTLGAERRVLAASDAALQALLRAGESEQKLDVTGTPSVSADPTLLARALANLLRNAREHGGELVSLAVSQRGDRVCFEVRDAGAGLTAEELERLTRPFARDGADSAGSLGLGLTLVARIALAHGGSLRVGEGSALVLELPAR